MSEAMLAFWLDYARAHPGYDGMDALEAEAPGLMSALEWAHEHARHKALLDLAAALRQAWYVRGRRVERLRIYTWAVQAAEALGDPNEQRWATHQLAETHRQIGRIGQARTGFKRALALAQQLCDPAAELDEVHSLAVLDRQTGRLEQARAGFGRALALAFDLGRLKDACDEVHELAVLFDEMGRCDEARAGFERALTLARQLGDPAAERREVHGLAVLCDEMGQWDQACEGFERALQLARQLGDRASEAVELCNLGLLLCEAHELERGRAMMEQSLAICERLSDVYWAGKCHQFLARIEKQQDNRPVAMEHYREALRRFEQVHSPDAEDVRAQLLLLGASDV